MKYSCSKRLRTEYICMLPRQKRDVIAIETDGTYFHNNNDDQRQIFQEKVHNYPVALGGELGEKIIIKGMPKSTRLDDGSCYQLIHKDFYVNHTMVLLKQSCSVRENLMTRAIDPAKLPNVVEYN